jgi:IS30 family transposase
MSYSNLTPEERYVISHLVLYGLSLREIGREIKRNRPTYADDAVYWHDAAQAYANQRKRMSHHSIRKPAPELVHYVKYKIEQEWAPEQIAKALTAGRLQLETAELFPENRGLPR